MDNVEQLMERREEISYALIESDSTEHQELMTELIEIESELEIGTGMNIEELENNFYGRENK